MAELRDARSKLGRAHDHFVALNRRIERFTKSDTYRVYADYNPHTTELILRLHVLRYPHLDAWALVVGDVAHNLRSALDHIVWELTIRHRGVRPPYPLTPDWTGIEFPIFRDKPVYLYGAPRKPTKNPLPRGSGLYKIRGVDPRLHARFTRLQPFRDGPKRHRNLLLVLHELDLIDKHRRIPLLASSMAPEEINVTAGPAPSFVASGIRLEVVETFPPGPFKDGTPLARIRQSGRWQVTTYSLPMHVEPKLSFSIELEKRRPTLGLPVLTTLAGMLARTEEIIEVFEQSP